MGLQVRAALPDPVEGFQKGISDSHLMESTAMMEGSVRS